MSDVPEHDRGRTDLRAAYRRSQAEVERLRKEHERAVLALAVLYREDYAHVAEVCDEQADRSGNLLGYVRKAACDA